MIFKFSSASAYQKRTVQFWEGDGHDKLSMKSIQTWTSMLFKDISMLSSGSPFTMSDQSICLF